MELPPVPKKLSKLSIGSLYRVCSGQTAAWVDNEAPYYAFDIEQSRFYEIENDPNKLFPFFVQAKVSERAAKPDFSNKAHVLDRLPFNYEDIIDINKAIEYANIDLGKDEKLLGVSQRMLDLFYRIDHVIPSATSNQPGDPILLLGDTGVGKELVARAIWRKSCGNDRDRPFESINCAGIPKHLIQSELFGHKKGAFTGATTDKDGVFTLAKKGVVFLDEIGHAPYDVQVALLRAINEKRFRKLNSKDLEPLEAQIISGTSRPLDDPAERSKPQGDTPVFLDALYYRLSYYEIKVPALRERLTDIPLLLYHFARSKSDLKPVRIYPDDLLYFLMYDWPGNVRELATVVSKMHFGNRMIRTNQLLNECRMLFYELPIPGLADLVQEMLENMLQSNHGRVRPDQIKRDEFDEFFEEIKGKLKLEKEIDKVERSRIIKGIRNLWNSHLKVFVIKKSAPSEIANKLGNNLNRVKRYFTTYHEGFDEEKSRSKYYNYYYGGTEGLPKVNIYSLCRMIQDWSGLDPWSEIKPKILGHIDKPVGPEEAMVSLAEGERKTESAGKKARDIALALPDCYNEALRQFNRFYLKPRWIDCNRNISELRKRIGKSRDFTRKILKESKLKK